jgi:hypothetical protein
MSGVAVSEEAIFLFFAEVAEGQKNQIANPQDCK